MYRLSNFLAYFLHKIIGYRRNIIETNLDYALPNLDASIKESIIKKYYRHITDLLIESIKACTLSREEFDKRFKVINPKLVEAYYTESQNIMIVTGHIGNWEWGATLIGSYVPHLSYGIYKSLSNPLINQYILKTRSRYDTILVEMKETGKIFTKDSSEPYAIILVSDQSPNNMDKAIWSSIFGKPTPYAHGMDDISRERKLPIIYADIKQVSRGTYELTFSVMLENPQDFERGYATNLFSKKIEELVIERNDDWLWSHKRWKKIQPPIY